jgi:hypothetical protein
MAMGTVIFFIAFVDEMMLELLGERPDKSGAEASHE